MLDRKRPLRKNTNELTNELIKNNPEVKSGTHGVGRLSKWEKWSPHLFEPSSKGKEMLTLPFESGGFISKRNAHDIDGKKSKGIEIHTKPDVNQLKFREVLPLIPVFDPKKFVKSVTEKQNELLEESVGLTIRDVNTWCDLVKNAGYAAFLEGRGYFEEKITEQSELILIALDTQVLSQPEPSSRELHRTKRRTIPSLDLIFQQPLDPKKMMMWFTINEITTLLYYMIQRWRQKNDEEAFQGMIKFEKWMAWTRAKETHKVKEGNPNGDSPQEDPGGQKRGFLFETQKEKMLPFLFLHRHFMTCPQSRGVGNARNRQNEAAVVFTMDSKPYSESYVWPKSNSSVCFKRFDESYDLPRLRFI